MPVLSAAEIPVVVLCGGQPVDVGLDEQRVKPLAPIAGKPLVSYVLRHYAAHGFKRFVLAAGLQSDLLRAAVERLELLPGVEVSLVETGAASATGERLQQIASRLEGAKTVAVTYSDTVCDVDLKALLAFHQRHQKLSTMLAAHIPTRFRVLGLRDDDDQVRGFAPKPVISSAFVNGGYYLFEREVFTSERYLGKKATRLVLEDDVLGELVKQGQLMAFRHEGRWQHFDNRRDFELIAEIVKGA